MFVEDTTNLGGPDGITFGSDGYLYVALVGSDAVVKVAPDGAITLLASGGPIQNPSDVVFGADGTLYAANFALFRPLVLLACSVGLTKRPLSERRPPIRGPPYSSAICYCA